jgi:hypothetical protein
VRTYLKSALPTSVYSRTGAPRLVLVTCGGPFDPISRHYRDNVVLTAVPAWRQRRRSFGPSGSIVRNAAPSDAARI